MFAGKKFLHVPSFPIHGAALTQKFANGQMVLLGNFKAYKTKKNRIMTATIPGNVCVCVTLKLFE